LQSPAAIGTSDVSDAENDTGTSQKERTTEDAPKIAPFVYERRGCDDGDFDIGACPMAPPRIRQIGSIVAETENDLGFKCSAHPFPPMRRLGGINARPVTLPFADLQVQLPPNAFGRSKVQI
jgi:hypothetical protein